MEKQFETFRKVREFLLKYISDLSVAQLNTTPEGFKNNIIWNLAHLIAAQQGVCYRRSGHKMIVEDELFEMYKPGTVSPQYIDELKVNEYKTLLLSTIDQLEIDYNNGLFANNHSWQ